jgi:exocyst complex protein 7
MLVSFVPIQTTHYLEQLLEVRGAVGPALMLLGDGNWKMGDGVQAKPNKGKPAPGSESVLIAHYACKFFPSTPRSFLTIQPQMML